MCNKGVKLFQSLLFSLISFALFCYGGITEILEDQQLHSKLGELTGIHVEVDRKWLRAIIIVYIISFTFNLFFVGVFTLYDCVITYKRNEGADLKQEQRALNTLIRVFQLFFLFGAQNKLILYGSLLNKARAAGLWHGSDDFNFHALFVVIPYWGTLDKSNWTIEEQIKASIMISICNIFRTMTLYIPMTIVTHPSAVKKFLIQVLLIPPSALVAALIGIKGVTSTMVEHYIQRHYTEEQDFSSTHNLVNSVVGAFFGIFIVVVLLIGGAEILEDWYKALCCCDTDDGYAEIEEAEAEKVAKLKGLWVRYLVTAIVFMYAVICFSITIAVHRSTGVWNWYFLVDSVYNGVLWMGCFCGCCYFMGKTIQVDQEYQNQPSDS